MEQKKYFEVGMRVSNHRYGNGFVTSIKDEVDAEYPIIVDFGSSVGKISFTFDGRYMEDEEVSLAQESLPPIVNKPIEPKIFGFFWDDGDVRAYYAEYGGKTVVAEYDGTNFAITGEEFRPKGSIASYRNFSTEVPPHLKP